MLITPSFLKKKANFFVLGAWEGQGKKFQQGLADGNVPEAVCVPPRAPATPQGRPKSCLRQVSLTNE